MKEETVEAPEESEYYSYSSLLWTKTGIGLLLATTDTLMLWNYCPQKSILLLLIRIVLLQEVLLVLLLKILELKE